mmetsp:Transcript_53201/g.116517  ORF Transcript_53201/g.116517 Transcript_53201/m.116517 type:complete len:204 (+) Transcript_53201:442-1053(+)
MDASSDDTVGTDAAIVVPLFFLVLPQDPMQGLLHNLAAKELAGCPLGLAVEELPALVSLGLGTALVQVDFAYRHDSEAMTLEDPLPLLVHSIEGNRHVPIRIDFADEADLSHHDVHLVLGIGGEVFDGHDAIVDLVLRDEVQGAVLEQLIVAHEIANATRNSLEGICDHGERVHTGHFLAEPVQGGSVLHGPRRPQGQQIGPG